MPNPQDEKERVLQWARSQLPGSLGPVPMPGQPGPASSKKEQVLQWALSQIPDELPPPIMPGQTSPGVDREKQRVLDWARSQLPGSMGPVPMPGDGVGAEKQRVVDWANSQLPDSLGPVPMPGDPVDMSFSLDETEPSPDMQFSSADADLVDPWESKANWKGRPGIGKGLADAYPEDPRLPPADMEIPLSEAEAPDMAFSESEADILDPYADLSNVPRRRVPGVADPYAEDADFSLLPFAGGRASHVADAEEPNAKIPPAASKEQEADSAKAVAAERAKDGGTRYDIAMGEAQIQPPGRRYDVEIGDAEIERPIIGDIEILRRGRPTTTVGDAEILSQTGPTTTVGDAKILSQTKPTTTIGDIEILNQEKAAKDAATGGDAKKVEDSAVETGAAPATSEANVGAAPAPAQAGTSDQVAGVPARGELPPPIELPQYREPGLSIGEKIRIAVGQIGRGATGQGGSEYSDYMNRKHALSQQRYQRAMEQYELQKKARGEQEAKAQGQQPIGADLARQLGLSPNTTWEQIEKMGQGGVLPTIRQGREMQFESEAARLKHQRDMEAQAAKDAAALEREKLKLQGRKGKGGGGGGGGGRRSAFDQKLDSRAEQLSKLPGYGALYKAAAAMGMQPEAVQQGLEDFQRGKFDSEAGNALQYAAGDTETKRIIDQFKALGEERIKRVEKQANQLQSWVVKNSDTIGGLQEWDDYLAKLEDPEYWAARGEEPRDIQDLLAEIANNPGPDKALSQPARDALLALKRPISAYMRLLTGAAMTPSEVGLHAGTAGGEILLDVNEASMGKRLVSWLRKAGSDVNGLLSIIDRVSDTVSIARQAVLEGDSPGIVRSLHPKHREGVALYMIKQAARNGNIPVPDNFRSIENPRYKRTGIEFTWVLKDGQRVPAEYYD